MMAHILKPLAVAGVAGTLAFGLMTSAEAQSRFWQGAGIGLATGAVVGATVSANSHRYYGSPYAYEPGYRGAYAYEPGYASGPVYAEPYGYYRPAPAQYGQDPSDWNVRQTSPTETHGPQQEHLLGAGNT